MIKFKDPTTKTTRAHCVADMQHGKWYRTDHSNYAMRISEDEDRLFMVFPGNSNPALQRDPYVAWPLTLMPDGFEIAFVNGNC